MMAIGNKKEYTKIPMSIYIYRHIDIYTYIHTHTFKLAQAVPVLPNFVPNRWKSAEVQGTAKPFALHANPGFPSSKP